MRKFRVTISNGERIDRFTMEAANLRTARRTAEIAHIGSGWSVSGVSAEKNK